VTGVNRRMWAGLKRLSLGVFLIALASAVLLISDWSHRRPSAQRTLRLAILQHASQPIIDEGVQGMIDGLAENGFVDGHSISIRRYNAEGDTATSNTIAKEITGGRYEMVLTATTVSLQAVANANRAGKALHVFALVSDPFAAGVGLNRDKPLDHPRHLVGYGTMQPVVETFRLARKMFPGLKVVGEVWNPAEANSEVNTRVARDVCVEAGIELLEANADNTAAVKEAASSLISRGAQALWVGGDVTVVTAVDQVVAVARAAGIPVFTSMPGTGEKGALFDIGANYHEVGRLAGTLAAQILNGTDPATIAVKNVMPERIVVNQTALDGLKDPWRLPDEVVSTAETLIDAQGVHKRAAAATQADSAAPPTAAPLAKTWKVDILEYVNVQDVEDGEKGIRAGLHEAGLVEGRDYALRVRNAQGDMPTLSMLVDAARADGADLLMTLSTPTLQAALQRGGGLPIVFTFVADAIAAGAGRSNEDHLLNVTGVPTAAAYEDMVSLIQECLPNARQLGTLFVPAEVNSVYSKDQIAKAAAQRGMELTTVAANTSAEVSDAALALTTRHIDAICQVGGNLTTAAFTSIAQAAQRAKVPVFSFLSGELRNGATIVAARDYFDGGREAGLMTARIMRGERPASMPFQPLHKTRLLVNLDAARAVGFTVPAALLQRADKVIGQH